MEEKKEATPPFCDLSEKDLAHLEELLGYEFNDKSLLKTSLRHRSWVSEVNNTLMSNERLEFLGDAVVGWAVTDIIYKKFSDLSEGKLTDIRKRSINADALSSVAIQLKLGEYIMLSAGEISTGGRTKISILCDVVEAVIGAIYLDGGRDICYELCERLMASPIEVGAAGDEKNMDSKNRLQELIAKRCTNGSNTVITYVHEEKGPSHAPAFMCSCFVDGDIMGTATERNKKTAEKAAAASAYVAIVNTLEVSEEVFLELMTEAGSMTDDSSQECMGRSRGGSISSNGSRSRSASADVLRKCRSKSIDSSSGSANDNDNDSASGNGSVNGSIKVSRMPGPNPSTCYNPSSIITDEGVAHLESLLGYEFKDKNLLMTALRHRSWVSEVNTALASNERLEFLGDAVVGWAVTDIIYKKFSALSEGKLTDIRKRSINADALSIVATKLKLGDYLMLSVGEISTGGRTKISILCDVMEAVIGAIYLDGGRDICYELCERHMAAPIEAGVVGDEKNMDSKNRLQELIAKRCTNGSNAVITYVHEEKGPSHAPAFMCSCFVDGDLMGTATQKNKKTAEKHAAAAARAAVIVHLAEQGQDIHDANPGREKLKSRPAKTSPEITPPVVDDKYMEDLVGLQSRMGYIFNDPAHLITSLRHRSWVAEVNNTLPSNERFEFIGDAVLSWVVTMFLHEKFPTYSEGRLGDIRSRAINTLSIKEAIETHALNIGNHVLLGCGEINDGGKNKESIKTGVFLAMLGAIFTDGGIDAARSCVERLMVIRIMATSGSIYKGNSKNQLEDFVCRNYPKGTIITYIHTEVPPKHNATFRCDCVIRGNIVGSSNGKSKKSAEKAAAESTLEGLMRLLASGNLDTGFKYEEEKEGEGEVEAET